MTTDNQYKIITVVGSTASGKTDFAIKLASELDGEIISADSRQIYQDINLGTGKPSENQLATVPHYFISFASLASTVTADSYARMARLKMAEVLKRKTYCFLVGGTGLWIQATIDGLAELPEADKKLRQLLEQQAEKEGKGVLYKKLLELDENAALKIGSGDQTRIIRALEIIKYTGKPLHQSYKVKQLGQAIPSVWFGMDVERDILYKRCEKKIDTWIERGWIEEVEVLLEKWRADNYPPAFKAIGVLTIKAYLDKQLSLKRCIEIIKRDTRRYIKRQLTWFKRNKRIIWINPEDITSAKRHIMLKNKNT